MYCLMWELGALLNCITIYILQQQEKNNKRTEWTLAGLIIGQKYKTAKVRIQIIIFSPNCNCPRVFNIINNVVIIITSYHWLISSIIVVIWYHHQWLDIPTVIDFDFHQYSSCHLLSCINAIIYLILSSFDIVTVVIFNTIKLSFMLRFEIIVKYQYHWCDYHSLDSSTSYLSGTASRAMQFLLFVSENYPFSGTLRNVWQIMALN